METTLSIVSWRKHGVELAKVFRVFIREGKFRSMIIFLKKYCQPCFHEIKNIYELQSLKKKSLSSQEFRWLRSRQKWKSSQFYAIEWLNFPSLSVQTASRPSDDHKWLEHCPQISNLEWSTVRGISSQLLYSPLALRCKAARRPLFHLCWYLATL